MSLEKSSSSRHKHQAAKLNQSVAAEDLPVEQQAYQNAQANVVQASRVQQEPSSTASAQQQLAEQFESEAQEPTSQVFADLNQSLETDNVEIEAIVAQIKEATAQALEEKNKIHFSQAQNIVHGLNLDVAPKYTAADEINLEASHVDNLDKQNVILASDLSLDRPAEELSKKSSIKELDQVDTTDLLVSMDAELERSIQELSEVNRYQASKTDTYIDMMKKVGKAEDMVNISEGSRRVFVAEDVQNQLTQQTRKDQAQRSNATALHEAELEVTNLDLGKPQNK